MEILQLLFVSSMPVLQVLLVTAVGSYLATDRVNLLSEETIKKFNDVVFYVFFPSLVSTNMAKSVTLSSIAKLWFMPVSILISFVIGSLFGLIIIKITRAPTQLRGLILGCCAAGNLGNMLFIIIPAICKEKGTPFGAPDTCHTHGMAYASLSMAIGVIYMWSYVYNIVRIYSSRKSSVVEVNGSINDAELSIEEAQIPSTDKEESMKVTFWVKFKQHLKMLDEKMNLKKLFAPPTIGAIVGFVIGVVPPFRKVLIGESAPLRVIQDSAALLGEGAIPVLTLLLGGNLLKGLQGPGIKKSPIVGIIIVRYVLLPISGVLVVKGAVHFGLVHADPLYQFVLLLQFALPPAINIGTMIQMFGVGEGECSVIMLWAYAIASVAVTLWSTLFMWVEISIITLALFTLQRFQQKGGSSGNVQLTKIPMSDSSETG